MESDEEAIIRLFAEACEEELARIEECLLELERSPKRDDLLNEVFRHCHTIKGDSATVGFDAPHRVAHVIEEALDRLRTGVWQLDAGRVTRLLESVDVLKAIIDASLSNQQFEPSALEATVERERERLALADESAAPTRAGATRKKARRAAAPSAPSTADTLDTTDADPDVMRGRRTSSLRIGIEVLDRILDLTGELSIARSRLGRLISSDEELTRGALRAAHRETDLLFNELHEEIMRARMVPIGPVFRQHVRTVRDLALADGKRARLSIQGAEAELDTTVIEHVRECLGHMVRNAIAHGIEAPEEREAAGKDPFGLITLTAAHEGGSILVELVDDGAGLDRQRIRSRAMELGLMSADDELTDTELDRLIFAPGFTTHDTTTLASGRGVGMDVVRENIEALGGTVHIESKPGKGCKISLRLPLTLAIIDSFEVAAGDEVFVIPLASVVECLDLPASLQSNETTGLINLRGHSLPFARLRNLLGIQHAAPARESIVVIHDGEKKAGIAVDALLGESQAVTKPLGKHLRDLPGVTGSTILANGNVALILDVPALLRNTVQWRRDAEDAAPAPVLGA